MIKNKYLSFLLIAGLALTACSSDDTVVEQKTLEPDKTYYLTVDATKGSDAMTRALNLSGSTLTASWATTDHVYVQGTLVSNSSKFWFEGSIQPQTAGTTTRLNGAISLPTGWQYSSIDEAIDSPHILNLQFPRSGALDYTGQKGTLADIAANYDYARAEGVRFDIKNDHIEGVTSASFENQQAIVKFTLIDNKTTKLSPTALTINYGSGTVSLTDIPAATYSTKGYGVLFVAIPGFSNQTVTLTATVGNDTYTYTTSSTKTFVNGKYYEIGVKMTK